MMRVTIEVENYGAGGDGPYRAGIAIVRINGEVHAKLRTSEAYEITVHEPKFSTHTIDKAKGEK